MVTVSSRPKAENGNLALEEKVSKQVAEIMDAATFQETIEVQSEVKPEVKKATWRYAMPFAGVRYFTYD